MAPDRFPDLPVVRGIRFASVKAALRYQNRHDLTLMMADEGSAAAGVFTQSSTAGHPVVWSRDVLSSGRGLAIIVNAGNANVFRSKEGEDAVRIEAQTVAEALSIEAKQVFVASTGVIGERLPVEEICAFVPELVASLSPEGIENAAEAIMTTDTFAKGASAQTQMDGKPVVVVGIAKGSGMIAPDMATMLAFVFTDAAIDDETWQIMLARCAGRTFNSITVDSDTSTSDTLLGFATGKADNDPNADHAELENALLEVCRDLALQIVRDGEGAQKLITIDIRGAVSEQSARRIGLSIGNSPLVKTAIAGGDANWGRVIMAIGKSGEPAENADIAIAFGGFAVAQHGGAIPDLDETPIAEHLMGRNIEIDVTVGKGVGKARVWTCDLTHAYIDINADYRS